MNLAVDVGNTRVKCALFEGDTMACFHLFGKNEWNNFLAWTGSFGIEHCIVSAVGDTEGWNFRELSMKGRLIYLSADLELPVEILYKTPETLGLDRIAAVVGAYYTFNAANLLIIDAGTCITYDVLLKDGKYIGGAISPGKQMRLKAMHAFTAKLPLIEGNEAAELIGKSTEESLRNGAQTGMIGEIEYWIDSVKASFGSVKTLVTGGDAGFIKNNLKSEIYEQPYLVLFGMSKILEQNVEF